MSTVLPSNETLATLVELAGSPEIRETSAGRTVSAKYSILWANLDDGLAAVPLVRHGAQLLEVTATRDGSAAMISASWGTEQSGGGSGGVSTAETIHEGDSNIGEDDIRQHPEYSSHQSEWEAKKITSYFFPAPTWSRTRIVRMSKISQAYLLSNVGKLVAPPGLEGATASKWLKMGRRCRQLGRDADGLRRWEVTDTYQCDLDGWDDTIYSTGGEET